MIRSILADPLSHAALDIQRNAIGDRTLMVLKDKEAYGQFKSVSIIKSPATYTIVSPSTDGAIVLTDLIVTTDKVAGSSVTIQFTDGTNTIVIFHGVPIDGPITFGMSFAGRWRGWKNARLDLVVVAALSCTVSVGYFKVGSAVAQSYTEWNALR